MSTLSVQSSRAARRRRTARNRGQGTAVQPVNSWSSHMPCGPPVAALCPPAQAPTRAPPTGSSNKRDSRCGVTRVAPDGSRKVSSLSRVLSAVPSPHFQGGADLAAKTDTEPVSSQGLEGAALFPSICSNQAGLQREQMGLQSSSSPPLTPYLSNLTQQRERKEQQAALEYGMAHERSRRRHC